MLIGCGAVYWNFMLGRMCELTNLFKYYNFQAVSFLLLKIMLIKEYLKKYTHCFLFSV